MQGVSLMWREKDEFKMCVKGSRWNEGLERGLHADVKFENPVEAKGNEAECQIVLLCMKA